MLSNNQLILLGLLVLGIVYIIYTCNKKGKVREPFISGIQLMQSPTVTWYENTSTMAGGGAPTYLRGPTQPLKNSRQIGPGPDLAYQGVVPPGQHGTYRAAPDQCGCAGYADMVAPISHKSAKDMDKDIHDKLKKKLQEMPSTADLLPEPDGDCPFVYGDYDPRKAENFLPPRQIFAVRKGRYQEGNDWIRGSLRIMPQARDWFYTAPNPANDLIVGALQQGHVGADMPSQVEGEGIFVTNLRQSSGLNRLDFVHGEQCLAGSPGDPRLDAPPADVLY